MARVSRGDVESGTVGRSSAGRVAQRRRTRKAIVEATMMLLERGETPTIDQIADAADVSRRTVYLHFPSLDQLLLDATLGVLSQPGIDTVLDQTTQGADAGDRVDALARELLTQSDGTFRLGRQLIRLSLGRSNTELSDQQPRRGYRRTEWIERALEPLREELTSEQFERLVSALSLVLGWEAMIVLRDIRGLSPDQEAATVRWAARTLVAGIRDEAEPPPPAGRERRPRRST